MFHGSWGKSELDTASKKQLKEQVDFIFNQLHKKIVDDCLNISFVKYMAPAECEYVWYCSIHCCTCIEYNPGIIFHCRGKNAYCLFFANSEELPIFRNAKWLILIAQRLISVTGVQMEMCRLFLYECQQWSCSNDSHLPRQNCNFTMVALQSWRGQSPNKIIMCWRKKEFYSKLISHK